MPVKWEIEKKVRSFSKSWHYTTDHYSIYIPTRNMSINYYIYYLQAIIGMVDFVVLDREYSFPLSQYWQVTGLVSSHLVQAKLFFVASNNVNCYLRFMLCVLYLTMDLQSPFTYNSPWKILVRWASYIFVDMVTLKVCTMDFYCWNEMQMQVGLECS